METSIWDQASADGFSKCSIAKFYTHPGILDTPVPFLQAWNFDDSAFNVNNYLPFEGCLGNEAWMNVTNGQDSMQVPLQTLFPPALPEAQFNFTVDTALPQPDATPLTNPSMTPASTNSPRVTCSVDGCGRTFVRTSDCRRHMLKHRPPKFKCAVIECDITFHRADKLRAHMKQGHKIRL